MTTARTAYYAGPPQAAYPAAAPPPAYGYAASPPPAYGYVPPPAPAAYQQPYYPGYGYVQQPVTVIREERGMGAGGAAALGATAGFAGGVLLAEAMRPGYAVGGPTIIGDAVRHACTSVLPSCWLPQFSASRRLTRHVTPP